VAVVHLHGFETQDVTLESTLATLLGSTISTAQARTGAASLRCNPASGGQSGFTTNTSAAYTHFGLRIASLPSIDRVIAGGGAATNINVRLTSAGTLAVYVGTPGTLIGTSSALNLNQWYWIGVRNTTGTSVVYLQIDGADAVTGTAVASGSSGLYGCTNTEASALDIYLDDIIGDDAGFLAPSKVALLVPISDNARAALWTGGAGGTTNLFDAVNNTPPIGTATETNLTQIEHAGGAAGTTDAYDANMTTYAAAGINTGDTVLGITFFIAHGEDIATGTKLLNFSLASNPVQATTLANFAAGNDPGALGTYPTNWFVTYNGLIVSPSVTVGSSPVMRVTRPETASRVASVCFMGMYVAWTPAAATKAPPFTRRQEHFASQLSSIDW
jgi:hypothetical protein